MATLTLNCPECDKEIKAPEEAVGKKIRCKGCEHVFVVAKPKAKAKAAPAKADKAAPKAKAAPAKGVKPAKEAPKPAKKDDDEEEGGYGLQDYDASYRCPDCANPMESEDAIVCLYCGYNTMTRTKPTRRKVKETTGGDKFMWLLPGVLAAISVPLMLGYCALHYFVLPPFLFNPEWDKLMAEGEGNDLQRRFHTIEKLEGNLCFEYLFHPAIVLWLVILCLFMSFFAGKFAIKRLFINNKPPEIDVK